MWTKSPEAILLFLSHSLSSWERWGYWLFSFPTDRNTQLYSSLYNNNSFEVHAVTVIVPVKLHIVSTFIALHVSWETL